MKKKEGRGKRKKKEENEEKHRDLWKNLEEIVPNILTYFPQLSQLWVSASCRGEQTQVLL